MRPIMLIAAATLAAAPVLAPALAQDALPGPFLTLPLDCDPGRTCYVEDYVDVDPGPAQADYACGINARDGHKGTDFALVSQADFVAGVAVIAAAPGRVAAIRDGMADRRYTAARADEIDGRECGNAVRIEHENGLQTLYCHLRQGSVRVSRGDIVARGAVLGLVGMSGQSNYPHVHLGVLGSEGRIDPFAPSGTDTCNDAVPGETLWQIPLTYTPAGLFSAGFSDHVPDFEDVKSGAARLSEGAADRPLVLYAHFHHAQDGDVLFLRAETGAGVAFETAQTLDETQINMFRAYGRKAPPEGWPAGIYTGTVRLERDGRVLAVRFAEITIP